MQLIGQAVKHEVFGKGVVVGCTDKTITVDFTQGEKRFVYPDAFAHHLTLRDEAQQDRLLCQCRQLQMSRCRQREREQKQQIRLGMLCSLKRPPCSQVVLDLSREQAIRAIDTGTVSVGCYLGGYSKGQPRVPARVRAHSACLLTGVPAGGNEAQRQVWGLMMAAETFDGKECTDGVIRAHEKYRLLLPESCSLRYWQTVPHGEVLPKWGRVCFRYQDAESMARVVQAVAESLEQTDQAELAQELAHRFRCINRLTAPE